MKRISLYLYFSLYSCACCSSMYYIYTPYGVMLIDLGGTSGFFASVIYENDQLSFHSDVTLQLIIIDTSLHPNLSILLASFLYYQDGNHFLPHHHGEGSPLEVQFINNADNTGLDLITEGYSEGDSIDYSLSNLYSTINYQYPCLFHCGKAYSLSPSRLAHYNSRHKTDYNALKIKYNKKKSCPICGLLIMSFIALTGHIQAYHFGASFYDF